MVCTETRHLKTVLSATVNKSVRDDAYEIAQLVRANLISPVHMKTLSSQEKLILLANRSFMLKQLCDTKANIHDKQCNSGLKVCKNTLRGREARDLGLVADWPALACLLGPMLRERAVLLVEFIRLQRMMKAVCADSVCQHLMMAPCVGPVTALTVRASVDIPTSFWRGLATGNLEKSTAREESPNAATQ